MSNELNIDEIYTGGGNYLKAADLKGCRTKVTIATVARETNPKPGEAPKLELTFVGSDKKWGLNVTNARMIAQNFGTPRANEWVGKTITLRPDRGQKPDGTPCDVIRVDMELPEQNGLTANDAANPRLNVPGGAGAAATEPQDIPF